MLRDDELPCPQRLAGLVTLFSANRGVPCLLTVSGTEHQLGADARLAVYRVAQEALTNIAKHARPERVELCLAYEPGATRLTVEDFTAADAGPDIADGSGARVTRLGALPVTDVAGRGYRGTMNSF